MTLAPCGFTKSFKRAFLIALHKQCISILCFPIQFTLHMNLLFSSSLQKSIKYMTPRNGMQRTDLACNIILTLRLKNYEIIKAENEFCPGL